MNKNLSKSKSNFCRFVYIFIIIFCISSTLNNYTYATENKIISDGQNIKMQDNSISDASTTDNLQLYSMADILLDAKTGKVLYEKNSKEKLYPASTTKLMTAILTMENCQLTDSVSIKGEWLNGIPRSYTVASLRNGETFTVDQLLHVLLIPSANDAANALACHISGNINEFAKKMNEKAKEIGCENTHFVNPSGIHDDEHYSTAHDMALIGLYASKYPVIKEIATMQSYSLPDLPDGNKRTFKTTNTLITPKNKYFYEYATGLKTGYTDKAKSCIVATAKKDDIELMCVVLGGDKTEDKLAQRELDCKELFEYGFNNYEYRDLCVANETVDLSNTTEIPEYLKNSNLTYSNTLNLLVPKNKKAFSTINFDNNKKLPIHMGTSVGTITYHVEGEEYTVDIVAAEDILPSFKDTIGNIFYILIAVFVLLFLFTIFKKKKSKKDRYFRHSFY